MLWNLMIDRFAEPWASAEFAANVLIQSTLLLGAGLIAGRALHRAGAAVQSVVYRTTLVAGLLCPLAAWALTAAGVDGLTFRLPQRVQPIKPITLPPARDMEHEATPTAAASVPDNAAVPAVSLVDTRPTRSREPAESIADASPVPLGSVERFPSANPAHREPDSAGDARPTTAWLLVTSRLFAAGWLVASSLLLLRLSLGCWWAARLRRSAVSAGKSETILCRQIAEKFEVDPPAVLRTPLLSGPCLVGLLRPAILLPEGDERLREALVHEMAHLIRRDCLWNLLRQLATAALPVQPLLWVLSRRIEQTAEEVCDDFVMQSGADRCSYAEHLVELASRELPPAIPASVGMISFRSLPARRIARLLDTSRTLSTRAGRRVLIAAALGGVSLTLVAALLGVGRADAEAIKEQSAESLSQTGEGKARFLSGRVLDPDGRPVPGAEIAIFGSETARERVTAGEDGQFLVSRATAGSDGKLTLTAEAQGFGVGWVKARSDSDSLTIRLPRLVPITGRIVDLEGRPAADVTLRIENIVLPGTGLDGWLDAVRRGEPPWTADERLGESLTNHPLHHSELVTDQDGRFRVEGIGAERLVMFSLHGPKIAYDTLSVVTRSVEPISWQYDDLFSHSRRIYGPDFVHAGQPTRPIRGVVRDALSGEPLASVGVRSWQFAGTISSGIQALQTSTDANGRFELLGMPKAEGNVLLVVPNDDQPYLMREVEVPDPPGLEPVEVAIDLHGGIWITGRITDKATGRPVAGALLHYLPFLKNTYAQSLPEFDSDGNAQGDSARYRTNEDGEYRLVGLPGPGIVGVAEGTQRLNYRRGVGYESIAAKHGGERNGMLQTWRTAESAIAGRNWPYSMMDIDPPEHAEEVTVDLKLDPGLSVPLRVVDMSGKPLPGIDLRGRTAAGTEGRTLGPEFDVINLAPDETRTVILRHRERKLGKVVQVSADAAGDRPLTIRLEPLAVARGRVLDGDGKPVVAATVRAVSLPRSFWGSLPESVATDSDGRFRFEDVPVGCDYSLVAHPPGSPIPWFAEARISVRPGETTDAGELRPMKLEQVPAPSESDASRNDSQDVPESAQAAERPAVLGGRIVAPDGKPVSGAKVRIWPDGNEEQDTTVATASDGRFTADLRDIAAGDELLVVTAMAEGFGTGWSWGKLGADDLTVKLSAMTPITGRVVDLEGRAVAGATVRVSEVIMPRDGVEDWLNGVRRGEPPWIAHERLGEWVPQATGFPAELKTDANGRLRIEGIGADRHVDVSIHGPTAAYTELVVVTRSIEPITWKFGYGFTDSRQVYGSDFTHVVSPARLIRGVVRDADSGEPLAGVGVHSWRFASADVGGRQRLKTTSDSRGRFELIGMPKGEKNELLIVPNDEQPYFMRQIEVPDPPGLEPIEMTIDLHRGLWITGRVTNKSTGQPVEGARLHYLPFRSNEFAQDLPEFAQMSVEGDQTRYVTNRDGEYRLVGLPGPAVVGVGDSNTVRYYRRGVGYDEIVAKYGTDERSPGGHLKTWANPVFASPKWPLSMKAIHPEPDAEREELNLELDPGLSISVRVVDQLDRPLQGVSVWGRTADRPEEDVFGPQVEIINFSPDETRTVMFRHLADGLGKVIRISPKDAKGTPITVRLEPLATITGRVVDADGKPVLATVRPGLMPRGDFALSLPEVVTDQDGHFRVEDVPVGCDYSLLAQPLSATDRWLASKRVSVEAGETTDAGELRPKRR